MDRRQFLKTVAAGAATMAGASRLWAAAQTRPARGAASKPVNILYILADDWGYGDLSCLNPESKIPTPHTDALAREGVVFSDAHSNSSVCTPTRYGVLTGRYAWRGRLTSGVLGGYDPLLIEPGRTTVASFLRQQGYRTACIGKWHLGLGWTPTGKAPLAGWEAPPGAVDFTRPLTAGPHTVGFDTSCIIPSSLDIPPYCYIENGRVLDPDVVQTPASAWPAFWRAGPMSRSFRHETCLLELTRRAEAYLADQAPRPGDVRPRQPFFLYFPMPSPHTPHVPRSPFRGTSRCGSYGDYVVEHDWSIGRLLAALDRHGLRDNTLVIVTSDNGAHCSFNGPTSAASFEKKYGHRSNYIYRGQKSDAWDGGHRIPFIARWPGVIAPGSACDRTVCLTDLAATCAQIVGAPLPAEAAEDSWGFLPYLLGDLKTPRPAPVIHHSITGQFAIRDGRWKYLDCPGSGGWTAPDEQAPRSAPRVQLYDMAADPGETTNLASARPDELARLQGLLTRQRGSPRSIPLPAR